MKYILSSALVVIVVLAGYSGVRAQTEITLIAPFGAKAPLDQLIPAFEASITQAAVR